MSRIINSASRCWNVARRPSRGTYSETQRVNTTQLLTEMKQLTVRVQTPGSCCWIWCRPSERASGCSHQHSRGRPTHLNYPQITDYKNCNRLVSYREEMERCQIVYGTGPSRQWHQGPCAGSVWWESKVYSQEEKKITLFQQSNFSRDPESELDTKPKEKCSHCGSPGHNSREYDQRKTCLIKYL